MTAIAESMVIAVDENAGFTVKGGPEEAKVVQTFWYAWSAFYPETEVIEKQPEAENQR